MLRITRRKLLKLSLLAGAILGHTKIILAAPFQIHIPGKIQFHESQTLGAFLRTLIPADETPSALQAGVKEKIIAKAAADSRYETMLRKGCQWLDLKARNIGKNDFYELSDGERELVVARAASGEKGSIPYLFFASMRYDAFYYYYADPVTWKSLNYQGPPQPKGFRDYVLPPRR